MAEQRRKLLSALALISDDAGDWHGLAQMLDGLARRHPAFGAGLHHLTAVEQALAKALADLGMPHDHIATWSRLHDTAAAQMIDAAHPVSAAAGTASRAGSAGW
jgi:hemoglobin-like flavoprotein